MAAPTDIPKDVRIAAGTVFEGDASTYNPARGGYRPGGKKTSTGELYNPRNYTAAIRKDLRDEFGGVRKGSAPCQALVEANGKIAIFDIKDVGSLKGGGIKGYRVIDLNSRGMEYYSGEADGVIRNVKVTPLPGDMKFKTGPVPTNTTFASLTQSSNTAVASSAPAVPADHASAASAALQPVTRSFAPASPTIAETEKVWFGKKYASMLMNKLSSAWAAIGNPLNSKTQESPPSAIAAATHSPAAGVQPAPVRQASLGPVVYDTRPAAAPAKAASRSNDPALDYAGFLHAEAQRMKIKGFEPRHAAALVGDMPRESGVNPASEPRYRNQGEGKGLIHWMDQGEPPYNRFANLQGFAKQQGTKWTNPQTQLKFMLHELYGPRGPKGKPGPNGSGSESVAGEALLRTKDIASASRIASTEYVRPLPKTARYDMRSAEAKRVFAAMNASGASTHQIASTATVPPAAPEKSRTASREDTARRPPRPSYAEMQEKPSQRRQRTHIAARRENSHYAQASSRSVHHFGERFGTRSADTAHGRYAARTPVAQNLYSGDIMNPSHGAAPAAQRHGRYRHKQPSRWAGINTAPTYN